MLAHRNSQSPAHQRFAWPGTQSTSARDSLRNAIALRHAVHGFAPDVLHSFSRLGYMAPILPSRLPKLMSYQRHTGGRQIAFASRAAAGSLRFTGCSEFICAMGRRSGGKWSMVPNFVEPEKITFVPRVAADAPLLFLSRVESVKGADIAIAVARASGRRLLIAGNRAEHGPERAYWDGRIAPHLGWDGVTYVGEVDDARKDELLGQAAALIVPIQWDEPFGIVFVEALAAGTPVITCARGALPEIITPGETGFFITSIADGVTAVHRLADLNREACRHSVVSRFTAGRCAAQYMALYSRMADKT